MTDATLPPIQQRLKEFIGKELRPGHNGYHLSQLTGDASARQYFRYASEAGKFFVLAAYPGPFDPDHFPYRQIYDLLLEIGLPVPRILAMDGKLAIILQEDLGNESLQRRLLTRTVTPQERKRLLCQALDHIVTIQKKGTLALKPEYEAFRLAFDEEKLDWELRFFLRFYLQRYRQLDLREKKHLMAEFSRLAVELAAYPRVLCHRNYHVRNLILKDGLVHIIDFQDARWGPPAYDLVSLLKDSIEVNEDEIDEHIGYYQEAMQSTGGGHFQRQFHLMSIQRLLKALGTYGYQVVERSNLIYRQYMAGSLRRTLLSLKAIPEFPYIRSVVEKALSS